MANIPVTDPALLAQLNAPDPKDKVTDPALLAVLNGEAHPLVEAHTHMTADAPPATVAAPAPAEPKSTLQTIREAVHAPTRALENGYFMGLGDRARAVIDSVLSGGGYGQHLKDEQADTEQFAKDHPIASPVIETIGATAGPAAVVGAAAKGATLGAKTLLGMATGGGIGAVQGAFGSKDWTDVPQLAKDTAIGGGTGAVIGGLLPGTAAAVGAAYNKVANAMRGGVEGMSRGAGSHLIKAVDTDGPAAVRARLDELGPDAVLGDAGPSLLGKLQGSVLNSDEARTVGTNALKVRDLGTNARIQSDVERALGPYHPEFDDPQTITNAIKEHRSAVDNVNYPAALDNAPPVQVADIVAHVRDQIPRTVGMERKALENLHNDLTVPAPKEAPPTAVAAPKAAPAAPAENNLAADVDAIRAKYGDAAAEAYRRQNQPAQAQSLTEFLASKGGLGPDAELEAIGAHSHTVNVEGVGRRKLVRQGGYPLDYAREAAEEAGYLQGDHHGTSTVNDLLDAIDREMRGQKTYPQGFEGSVSKREAAAMSERQQHEYDSHIQGLHDDLAAAGHGQLDPEVKQRAVHLMANEGMGADTAVDHALAQLDQEAATGAHGFPGDRPLPAAAATPGPARVPKDDATILHRIKQELDNVIEYDAPGLGVPAGALQRQQGTLKILRGRINAALEKQVPGYAEANAASAALAKRIDAVKAGTQYLGGGKTTPSPGRFAAEFAPLEQGEKIALAKGSRGEIERILGTNPNDLVALKRELQGTVEPGEPGAGWNTAKLATVHGRDAADELVASVDRNMKFRDTHQKVIEGSQTDIRNAARKEMKPDPSTETPFINSNATIPGMIATAGKKGVQAVANALLKNDPTRHYGEVARALTLQGAERDARLMSIVKAIEARKGNAAASTTAGNIGAVTAALLGKVGADELRNGPMRRQLRQ